MLGELGRGGMGVVYKARQRTLDRVVALKMIREARLSSDADRGRFRAEAEAAARLKHPNIVTVYEVGHRDGQAYFVMEYVEGQTLGQRLAERPAAAPRGGPAGRRDRPGRPPRPRARHPAPGPEAGEHPAGESADRSRGSPQPNESAVPHSASSTPHFAEGDRLRPRQAADRGPGSAPRLLTQTGAIVGTPGYMAPEQATGRKDLTPAADVYALGAILYECSPAGRRSRRPTRSTPAAGARAGAGPARGC